MLRGEISVDIKVFCTCTRNDVTVGLVISSENCRAASDLHMPVGVNEMPLLSTIRHKQTMAKVPSSGHARRRIARILFQGQV